MRSYALGFVSPAWFLSTYGNRDRPFCEILCLGREEGGSNGSAYHGDPESGCAEKPYQCENRMGYMEAAFSLFNHKLPTIEHTECMFNGAKACRYRITWRD